MSAPPPPACRDPGRGAVGLVLLIAAACIGTCALVTLVFCGPHVL